LLVHAAELPPPPHTDADADTTFFHLSVLIFGAGRRQVR